MVVNVVFLIKVYICHCYHGVIVIWKNLKIKAKMIKIEGLVKKSHHIYETYKNTVMPHGRHIYAKEYDIAQATMCAYTQYDHAPPHWKFLLWCCTESVHVSIFLTKKHIIIIQTRHPQYSFTFIISLDIVLLVV